jgi:hypothetical protein
LKLLASDHPDEAHGLSSSLVECATNLRYLTADPSEQERRTRDFVKFAIADKAFWNHHALESAKSKKEKAELRAYAKQLGIIDNTRPARQHWAGKSSVFVWYATMLDHPCLTALSRWATGRRRMPWIITKPPRLCIAHYQRLIVITLMMAFRFAFRLPLAIMRPINQLCSSSLSMFTLLSAMCCLAWTCQIGCLIPKDIEQ